MWQASVEGGRGFCFDHTEPANEKPDGQCLRKNEVFSFLSFLIILSAERKVWNRQTRR